MSLQSELMIALAAVAGGQIYPQMAPAEIEPPFVVYRILAKEPLGLLSGGAASVRYSIAFECYGTSYQEALTTAAAVSAAIDASDLTTFHEASPGEDYIFDADEFMEPVFVGIWHE